MMGRCMRAAAELMELGEDGDFGGEVLVLAAGSALRGSAARAMSCPSDPVLAVFGSGQWLEGCDANKAEARCRGWKLQIG